MSTNYSMVTIDASKALEVARELYNLSGEITTMPGESDFNFKLTTDTESYLLKISRPNEDMGYVEYQCGLLTHISNTSSIEAPRVFPDIYGNNISETTDKNGEKRIVRLLSWIDGRLWSRVNPINEKLLYNLGQKAGELNTVLNSFDHPYSESYLEWDISNALWCKEKLNLFKGEKFEILSEFLSRFEDEQNHYSKLRKSIVHSDVNDNNILVINELSNPTVKSIIDFGDAIKTETINDLAIAVAYAAMDQPDALDAAVLVVKGYHEEFPLTEDELVMLHTLVAMRLTITVTKSAMNKIAEPENNYHQISEKPAWKLLEKWIDINPTLAECHFRKACGYTAHMSYDQFCKYAQSSDSSLHDLFPSVEFDGVKHIDMSVSSTLLGHSFEYNNLDLTQYKIEQYRKQNSDKIIAGGYLETRPFYSTDAFKKEGNNGPEYRAVHAGIDVWVNALTPIHSFLPGEVFAIHNNDFDKDYGPTLVLKHTADSGLEFYSLYGHLSRSSLNLFNKGDKVNKSELIGYIGEQHENGGWAPHLHFQVMLDMLGNETNFQGVIFHKHTAVWKEITPDPALFFSELEFRTEDQDVQEIIDYRSEHLGKSLSLSYDEPLNIVRGEGVYLIDSTGRKYLDTVNNVAHVGHEHPRVVQAGREQMALLNTNTRYLHENITSFAKELLETFPNELSVVHFVNSGSEANELALRMAQAVTKQKDMIAVEIGYHGNTQACMDVSSYKFDGKGGEGAPEHTHIVPLPDQFRGLYTGKDAGERYAGHIATQIEAVKSKGRNIAGFICESIISCGGQIELPENYLKTAYAAVRKEGGICISDEVQVGLGRVGSQFWGFELHDVIPDIVTIGKPIGNGHPLAAVVCTKRVAEVFANGMEYFNTFGGNPVSSAIGREVLRVVKDEKLQENALIVGNYLKEQLVKLQQEFPIIQSIRGQGLFLGFELVDENKNPLPEKATYLVNRMKDFAILMSTDGRDRNTLKIKPPMVFSMKNADELMERMRTVLQEDFILLYFD